MNIPADLISGTYYIRVYTKWLRNFSPLSYSYLSIRIINPERKSLLPVDSAFKLSGLTKIFHPPDHLIIKAETDKKVYSKREAVSLTLSGDMSNNKGNKTVISVIPSGALDHQVIPDNPRKDIVAFKLEYLPETRGLSLSGKSLDSGRNNPLPYSMVYLTLLNDQKRLQTIMSDSQGSFYLPLPFYKEHHDLFVSAYNPIGKAEMLIANDFCTLPKSLPSLPLNLDSADYLLAIRIITTVQVNNQFFPESKLQPKTSDNNSPFFFYGKPSLIIEMSDYIDLPDMEEYLHELLPMISIRKNKTRKEFVINGAEP